ncbi:carbon-nitrogen hydrolase family protein [Nocardioides sp. KIGAM211]|uniref:Carbon-nitrogen hydrolase family protein n=1 Tax=Nocardioides luti TaxID=2761101 RepID=A0A7X0VBV2_9ACTN|nr:carbon-nitrogen hydrolase family protein [Nocardioides luti]
MLRVAAAQAASVSGDVPANVATAVRLVELAGSQGVRVLLLPEAFLTGYDEAAFSGPLPDADSLQDAWLDPLRAAAAASGLVVVAGTALRRGDRRTLSLVVVAPDGHTLAAYDKQHVDADELPWFTAGSGGSSLVVDGVELGLAVCYDSSFPEHARAAADDGAVGYLCSAAFFPGSAHRRDLALPARALDNGMYVVLAAATGTCGAASFIGGSAVFDPEGRPLASLGAEEGLAIADLDPAVVAQTRTERRMHAERLPGPGPRARHSA